MSGNVTFKIEGLRELEKRLVAVAEVGAPAVLAKALRDPFQQVLEDAKALVPVDSGALLEALALTSVKRASSRRASMAETLSEVGLCIRRMDKRKRLARYGKRNKQVPNPRSYWHLVEFGTARAAARPFIRPAFDKNTQALLDGFKRIVLTRLTRLEARSSRGRR